MTQDQRNAFVKLVEQVKQEFRSRRSLPYDEEREQRDEQCKKLEQKYEVGEARKRFEQAREAMQLAERMLNELERRIGREVSQAEREEGREFDAQLQVFTLATAEVLALDDAKEAEKVIGRLAKL